MKYGRPSIFIKNIYILISFSILEEGRLSSFSEFSTHVQEPIESSNADFSCLNCSK